MNIITRRANYTLLTFFLLGSTSFSQFVFTGGPGASAVAVIANDNFILVATGGNGIYRSINNGNNWTAVNSGLTGDSNMVSLVQSGSTIFAGTTSHGVFRSTDNGITWVSCSSGLPSNANLGVLYVSGSFIYAGYKNANQIFSSSDGGSSWNPIGPPYLSLVISLYVTGNTLFAGTDGAGVYKTTNNGINWTVCINGLDAANRNIYVMKPIGSEIHIATAGGSFKSTNMGDQWIRTLPWSNVVKAIETTGTYYLYAGSTGIFWSSNSGSTFNDPNNFFMIGHYMWSLAKNSTYIFAGDGSGIWRRPISELTGLTPISNSVPLVYSLSQNYPNPFNPSTKIEFALPKSGEVKLGVYNELGERVADLLDQKLDAGTYSYSFDASSLSSGVYFYRLTGGDFSEAKRMILVK